MAVASRGTSGGGRLAEILRQLLLDRSPAGVVINRGVEAVSCSGPTHKYFLQHPCAETSDLMAQARHGLRGRLRAAVYRAVRESRAVTLAGVRVRRDGEFHRVRVTIEPLKVTGETAVLFLVCFEDEPAAPLPGAEVPAVVRSHDWRVRQLADELTTTRESVRRTVEELQAARAFAESILDSLREGVLVLDRDLRVVSANRSFYAMFRLLRKNTEGKPVYALRGRQWDLAPLRSVLKGVVRGKGELVDVELACTSPDIGPSAVRLSGRSLSCDSGRGGLFLLTFTDFTPHKVAQRALEESEARFRGIVDSVADGIVTVDGRGTIMSFNRAAERMFGYAEREMLGQKVNLLMAAPYRDEHARYLRDHVATGQVHLIGIGREVTGRRKDGTEFPIDLAVSEYHDERGARFVGILKDVSERKAAEQRLRQREAELAHTQRQQTLGELAAGLAHELAQPLAAVTNELGGCVRFVRAGRLRPRTLLASLQRAAEGAEHAAGVLQHVRELVEKRPSELQVVDLRGVVASAVDLVRKTAEHHRVRLRLARVVPRPLSVRGDRIRLEQVLVNLLQNAIEAIATVGPVRREVEVTCRQTAAGTAEVAVHDSGPGLTRSERSQLFEPFFTTKPHGLGMGLAISRRIIEDHEGRIEVPQGRPGGGATVRCFLPLVRQRRAKRQQRRRAGKSGS